MSERLSQLHDELVVFNEEGQRLCVDSQAAAACTSVEQLADFVTRASLPSGMRCYSFLRLPAASWKAFVKRAESRKAPFLSSVDTCSTSCSNVPVSPPHTTAAAAAIAGATAGCNAASATGAASGSPARFTDAAVNDAGNVELKNLSLSERPAGYVRLRRPLRVSPSTTAVGSGPLAGDAMPVKPWTCAPLAALPLDGVRPLEEWPCQEMDCEEISAGSSSTPSELVDEGRSLSFTLPYQDALSASGKSTPSPLFKTVSRVFTDDPLAMPAASPATATPSPTLSAKRMPATVRASRPSPWRHDAPSSPSSPSRDALPANALVLIALSTTAPAAPPTASVPVSASSSTTTAVTAAAAAAADGAGAAPGFGASSAFVKIPTDAAAGAVTVPISHACSGDMSPPYTPDVRTGTLPHRLFSNQSIVSPTGRCLPMDAPLQQSSSAQYGLSSGRTTGVSAASFPSLTTPLLYQNLSTPTLVRGMPHGWGSTSNTAAMATAGYNNSVTSHVASTAATASVNPWVAPNLSDSFSPSMVYSGTAASEYAYTATTPDRLINVSFASAASGYTGGAGTALSGGGAAAGSPSGTVPLLYTATPQLQQQQQPGARVCLAASHDAFPRQLGKLKKVKCIYGDSRYTRASKEKRKSATALTTNAGLSSASLTNHSITAVTPGVLPRSSSSGNYVGAASSSSANNSFASPFGAAGFMQPVPSLAQQPRQPHAQHHLQQQQYPQQQLSQLQLQQQRLAPHHAHAYAHTPSQPPHLQQHQYPQQPQQQPPVLQHPLSNGGSVTPYAAAFGSPTSNPRLSPSAASSIMSPPSPRSLYSSAGVPPTCAHVSPWHNAVPPLPKSTVSLAIALHIADNKDVVQCLLRHYESHEIELAVAALRRGHPFLRSAVALEFVFGADTSAAAAAAAAMDGEWSDAEESNQGSNSYTSRCSNNNNNTHHPHHTTGGNTTASPSKSSRSKSEDDNDAEDAFGGGAALRKSPPNSGSRRSVGNFSAATPTSVEGESRRRCALTPAQTVRQSLLYRQYFAYVACCVEEHAMALTTVVNDVEQAAKLVQLTHSSGIHTTSNSTNTPGSAPLSTSRARPCVSGAFYPTTTDEDEMSIPCGAKSTVAPSTPSYESPDRIATVAAASTVAAHPLLSCHRSSDTFSYTTSGVYSLGRTMRPLSGTFEDSTKRDQLQPSASISTVSPAAAQSVTRAEVEAWLKLTPPSSEVAEVLRRPLSFLDRTRQLQMRRLRQRLTRVAPRTAAALRDSQLHLLLRGACDDEELAMEGLMYLVSVTKPDACNGSVGDGGTGATAVVAAGSPTRNPSGNTTSNSSFTVSHSKSGATIASAGQEAATAADAAAPSPPEQRSALAKAFATIQQRNEEVGWFTEVEKAVVERRIKPSFLRDLVLQISADPNAIVNVWYDAEEGLRETLKLTAHYLTRRPRAG